MSRPRAERCPLCKDPTAPAHAPFCSRRCKDRDLLNWLGETYRTPVHVDEAEPLDSESDDRL